MNESRLTSSHFPYLPITITVSHRTEDAETLFDTGFDGFVAVPPHFVTNGAPPDNRLRFVLADGSVVSVPAYRGEVTLGPFGPIRTIVIVLGDEVIIGRRLTERFLITLDHGKRLTVEE